MASMGNLSRDPEPSSHRPVLERLRAAPGRHIRALRASVLRRAAVEALCVQLFLLPASALMAAAAGNAGEALEPLWLRAALASWAVWFWPLFRLARFEARARRSGGDLRPARLAERFDRLNPAAPDVFRTALRPGTDAPETLDALESLYASWEPRLRHPEIPAALSSAPGRGSARGSIRPVIRRRVLIAGAVFAVLAVLAPLMSFPPVRGPDLFGAPGAVLYRMALPLHALRAIPAARLTPLHVRERVTRGDTLIVAVHLAHVPKGLPVHARVLQKSGEQGAGSRERRYNLARNASGDTAVFRLGPVTGDFTLRFTAQDAATRDYRIKVIPPPRLKSFSGVVIPPAYTRLPVEEHREFPQDARVLPGSRIRWNAEAERALGDLTVMWSGGGAGDSRSETVPETERPNEGSGGRRFAFSRVVRDPLTFSLRLREPASETGAGGTNGFPVTEGPWRVSLMVDEPPHVTLVNPAVDGELPRALKVAILFRAGDDFGLSRIWLRYALRSRDDVVRAEGSRDVTAWLGGQFGSAGGGGIKGGNGLGVGAGVWDATPLKPEPGEMVELHLEAVDNDAVTGPKRTRSATVRLRLPSADEARTAFEERAQGAATSLTSALERARRMREEEKRAERPESSPRGHDQLGPTAAEWDVRRVLVDQPRQLLQQLRGQLEREAQLAQSQARTIPGADEPRSDARSDKQTIKALEALRQEAAAMEKRLPSSQAVRAPVAEQQKALANLNRDHRSLEKKLAETRPFAAEERRAESPARDDRSPEGTRSANPDQLERAREALRQSRAGLEEDLRRNLKEQKELQGWLEEKERLEAARDRHEMEAARHAERMERDVRKSLEQLGEAMRKGLEDGTITPDVLEKMDRVRELLEEVLEDGEKDRLRRQAEDQPVEPGDLQKALDDMLGKRDGLREDLERAIVMLEALRDVRALKEVADDMRALEEEQSELAAEMAAELATESATEGGQEEQKPQASSEAKKAAQERSPASLAAEQEALKSRLDKALKKLDELSRKPALRAVKEKKARDHAAAAREAMAKAASKLKEKSPDRKASRDGADLAARRMKAAAAELDKMMAQLDAEANLAEIRAVLEETLELTRWLEGGAGSRSGFRPRAHGIGAGEAQGAARVGKWLAGRMERLADGRAFDSEVLRREATAMAAQADLLAVPGSAVAVDDLRRHARGAARELLKWLNQSQESGGSQDGDGVGDTDHGGGEQGESGQEGASSSLTKRMRGVSGKQMAANRMTQELLRSMMRERQERSEDRGSPPSGSGKPGGSAPGGSEGSQESEGGRGTAGAGNTGEAGGSRQGASPPGGDGSSGEGESGASGESGNRQGGEQAGGESGGGAGAAANAQQQVADLLESLAESASDAGGAARKLRELAEEARKLERALRGSRLDPGETRRRQERFRTRLLEATNALEERGQTRERRAEAYAGGLPALERGPALPVDSLAAALRRHREAARKLPLTPEQKRRVEWYYESLLGP